MYNFHQLGWYSFQQLCVTIAREVLGQTTMSFLGSGDGGKDGCFSGQWIQSPNRNETLRGKFIFQCKFTSKINHNLTLSDLKDEFPKAEKLVKKGLCDIYVLITNANISGNAHGKIELKLKGVGIKEVLILGADWLSQTINENKRLRRLVPRLYGLGDLSQILDERVYLQGKTLLESLKDELAKVVITKSYQDSAEALDKYGFVLLIGEPAAGKTTIASLLAMGALDQWGTPTLKLDTANQVVKHWNPEDPQQFFWIDDAFGVTQYESNLVMTWNHRIPEIKAMLKNGAKIVMTSRDYIYSSARNDLKEGAFPLLNESQVVIDVHKLTIFEKRQMLYNHIKLGTQPLKFRKEIKPFLEFIANLPRFIPEIARRLASPFFTKNLYMDEWYIKDFVDKRESFLLDVINGLDKHCQAALALIYMSNDSLQSPIDTTKPFLTKAVDRIGSSLGGCTRALKSMEGSLVQLTHFDGDIIWKFKHPTIGDAFAIHVVQSPELIEIYLQGTPVEELLSNVTCGDVGIEKATIVPKSFYLMLLKRLKDFTTTKQYKSEFLSEWGAKRTLYRFLTTRCSEEFLKRYLEANPDILGDIATPGLSLEWSSEIDLAYRLFQFKLLPELTRKKFVDTISGYALQGEDLYALKSEKIGEIFTKDEMEHLFESIKKELVPKINKVTARWQYEYDDSNDAADYMESLLSNFDILKDKFADDKLAVYNIDNEIRIVKNWIDENHSPKPKMPTREKLANKESVPNNVDERSIFDDIDVL